MRSRKGSYITREHSLNPFFPPEEKLWKGTLRLGNGSFSSHRASMHALSISHLCIHETQVNKQNIHYQTHTWAHTALRSRQHVHHICTTRLTISLCNTHTHTHTHTHWKLQFLSQGFSGCDPASTHENDRQLPASASPPDIGQFLVSGVGPSSQLCVQVLLDNDMLVGVSPSCVCVCVCSSGVCPHLPSCSKERRQAALVCDGHI